LGKLPIIYVTSGTVFNNSTHFFKTCFAAFENRPYQVILTTGKPLDQLNLGPIPENFIVRSYVPQLELLQFVAVSISHAGMGTIMESIYRGVPMVVMPQAANQQPNSRRVAELGLGIQLDKGSITVEALQNAVTTILSDDTFRARVQQMRENTDLTKGYLVAADALQQFAKNSSSSSLSFHG
jgi:MGT family glycosyltransferase